MPDDLHPAAYATTAIAAGDLFEVLPRARVEVALMSLDATYEPQVVVVEALRERGLIDQGDRPHDEVLRALVSLAGQP